MALQGHFLVEVKEYVSALTEKDDAVVLDAATGAGETTVQIAQAMKGGKLITVDCDPTSWHEWALPALRDKGVIDRVEFLQANLQNLPVPSNSVDLVVSDASLSAVYIYAVDAIKEFHRVLKPSCRLALADLLPENETEPDPRNIAALGWRLAKAAAQLAGKQHYQELPSDWVRARLADAGFEIISFEMDRSRHPASQMSYEEWRTMDIAADVPAEILRKAIQKTQENLLQRAEKEGLTTKTGRYACWARKPN